MQSTGQRKINLLNEGTGIRFGLKPQRKSILKSKQFKFIFGLATLALLGLLSFTVGGMMLDFLDFSERVAPEDGNRGSAHSEKALAKKAGTEGSGEGSPSNEAAGPTAFNERPKVPAKKRVTEAEILDAEGEVAEAVYFVRYALFLKKENAEVYSAKLQQMSLLAEVLETLYPLPSYTIKAGPFVNPNSRKVTQKELKKLGVALTPFIEQKYLVSKPVWKKSKALEIQKKLMSLGVSTELSMERSPKTVFKVVSSAFDNRKEANEYAEIAKEDGLKVIVEEGEKIDEPEGAVVDGEEKGEEPEKNGEKQQK
jgi:hypothetical protein